MKRSKIHPRKSKLHKTSESLAVFFVLLSFLLIFIFWNRLPERIPIYFNSLSKDEYGMANKQLLWTVPVISCVLVLMITLLSRFVWLRQHPVRIAEEKAERKNRVSAELLKSIALVIAVLGFLFSLASVLAGMDSSLLFGSYLQPAGALIMVSIVVFYLLKLIRLS